MYKNTLYLGTNNVGDSSFIQKELDDLELKYKKHISEDFEYACYEIKDVDWIPEIEEAISSNLTRAIMESKSACLIRIGDDPDDVEVMGNPEDNNLTFTHDVSWLD